MAELAQLDLSADQREKVRAVMEADRTANMDAIAEILTPEQKAKLAGK